MDVHPIAEKFVKEMEAQPPGSKDPWDGGWPQSPEEFEAMLNACLERLVRYAYRRLGNMADAEDVVQEVFVRAFIEREKRKNVRSALPYLWRMTANACTDFLRKKKWGDFSLEEVNGKEIPGREKSPAERASEADGFRQAEELLGRLPKKQAEAIRLRVYDGLSLIESAEVLGCSMNTVGSRLRYGFKKLRKIVSKRRGFER